LVLLYGGCATTGGSPAEKKLVEHMAQCSEKYGYDPKKSSDLGEYELGPMEREWRSCVYEGIRTVIIPRTSIPEVYENLIEQDRDMTDAIEKGRLTRSQRESRVNNLIQTIRAREDQAWAKHVSELGESTSSAEAYRQQLGVQENFLRGLGK
jgi:hypothetical protein